MRDDVFHTHRRIGLAGLVPADLVTLRGAVGGLSDTGGMAKEQDYEFDIAVTFAGEDRDYVSEVVEGVKGDTNVFYDEDYQVEAWGQDGVEYFTDVYMNRTRYVVMFISQHYAEKMWTKVERRAALAKAATQRQEYILPVRLDDTELPGMPPTTIYLDSRRMGLSGLIEATKLKIAGGKPATPAAAPEFGRRVPRTAEEIQALMTQRVGLWEYLLYAGVLRRNIDALEPKHRDHMIGYARRTGEVVEGHRIVEFAQAALADGQHIAANFGAVLDHGVQEAAFGKPGEPGDLDRILHMAERFTSVYEEFMDWAARLRGCTVNNEHARNAFNALAKTADENLESMRDFVDRFFAEVDTAVDKSEAGETVNVELVVTLTLNDELIGEFNEELRLAVEGE